MEWSWILFWGVIIFILAIEAYEWINDASNP